jgi:hypothetical protein
MHGGREGRGHARCSRTAAGWVVGFVVLALGCATHERADVEAQGEAEPTCLPSRVDDPPVITTLVTRDHEVRVHAGVDGPRLTVLGADGSQLGRMLTPREFERQFPMLRARFDAAFAGDEPWLDASARRPAAGHPWPEPSRVGSPASW